MGCWAGQGHRPHRESAGSWAVRALLLTAAVVVKPASGSDATRAAIGLAGAVIQAAQRDARMPWDGVGWPDHTLVAHYGPLTDNCIVADGRTIANNCSPHLGSCTGRPLAVKLYGCEAPTQHDGAHRSGWLVQISI